MGIIVYSTDCPKCRIIEQKLKEKDIDYTVNKDVDLMMEKGFMSAPMLEVDGNVMSFSEAMNWVISHE